MPFWIKSDFLSAVCLESLTVSIALLEYLRILPWREKCFENSPRKDATTAFVVNASLRLSYLPHFVRLNGKKASWVLIQASPGQLVCFDLTRIVNCFFLFHLIHRNLWSKFVPSFTVVSIQNTFVHWFYFGFCFLFFIF